MSHLTRFTLCLAVCLAALSSAWAQTTGFTYQGKLNDGANPANGNYDIQFKLFDTATVGTGVQQGPTVTNATVSVAAGIFSAQLDFGLPAFSGPPRYLELGVRPTGSPNAYTVLGPRSPVSSTPFSVRSLNASVADTLSSACVGCVTGTQIGSLPSNFNISGTGTANILNATTQFNIGGTRVLSASGSTTFVGTGAGINNGNITNANSFFGNLAGNQNTAGTSNSFFGASAGALNVTGSSNSFFGYFAGRANTVNFNSFFGSLSGAANTTGVNNSFFGALTGAANTTGGYNSFFGEETGSSNTTGGDNSFFGATAGKANTTGSENSFFGYLSGYLNVDGSNNSFFGGYSGANNTSGTNNSFFGEHTGFANTVGSSNSFFGGKSGAANTSGAFNTFTGYRSGQSTTSGSQNSFFGEAAGISNTTGHLNSFFGQAAGQATTTGQQNSFVGMDAGFYNTTGDGNSFFGFGAGDTNTTGSNNTIIGAGADVASGFPITFGTAIGAGAVVGTPNSVVIGRPADAVYVPGIYLRVTGDISARSYAINDGLILSAPDVANTLLGQGTSLVGSNLSHATAIGFGAVASLSNSIFLGRPGGEDAVRIAGATFIDGILAVHTLSSAGSTSICLNSADRISSCSSSLRYKTSVQTFTRGLDIVRRLRPITFDWKEGGMHDVGFGAEEVNEIEPLLTTRNSKGEIEGVKYAQITTVLVNAVNEQQAEIEAQRKTNGAQARQIAAQQELLRLQQQQLDELKRIVCQQNPHPACKEVPEPPAVRGGNLFKP